MGYHKYLGGGAITIQDNDRHRQSCHYREQYTSPYNAEIFLLNHGDQLIFFNL